MERKSTVVSAMTTCDEVFRVGDYVYWEGLFKNPYHIIRIDEFIKTTTGNMLFKGVRFFRKRDLPSTLVSVIEHDTHALEVYGWRPDLNNLSSEEKYNLEHRELYISLETRRFPVSQIVGKCSVTFLHETESVMGFLNQDDTFFYRLAFDNKKNTLFEEKGDIRVGNEYQVTIPTYRKMKHQIYDCQQKNVETLLWMPSHNLTDCEIDEFVGYTKLVSTISRVLYSPCSTCKHLNACAAAASRDTTILFAMDILHRNNYTLYSSMKSLFDESGRPVRCSDEIENWSQEERHLFIAGLKECGKDFGKIRKCFLPWKSMKNLVEYYYFWKTTDQYVEMKKKKFNSAPRNKTGFVQNRKEITNQVLRSVSVNRQDEVNDILPFLICESCNESYREHQVQVFDDSDSAIDLCKICWIRWKKYGHL